MGKTKFTRNRKIDRGVGGPARNLFPKKTDILKARKLKLLPLDVI